MSSQHKENVVNNQPIWLTKIESGLFGSRWLQAPLYFGLVVAQAVYVFMFCKELWHMIHGLDDFTETAIMLSVLGLIDIVMISNLLFMVIIGGYETFVSKIYIDDHPDKPEWFSHVDAGVLKVKLSLALIGISSIHLLKTFVAIETLSLRIVIGQVLIHTIFIVSAYYLAKINNLMKGIE